MLGLIDHDGLPHLSLQRAFPGSVLLIDEVWGLLRVEIGLVLYYGILLIILFQGFGMIPVPVPPGPVGLPPVDLLDPLVLAGVEYDLIGDIGFEA